MSSRPAIKQPALQRYALTCVLAALACLALAGCTSHVPPLPWHPLPPPHGPATMSPDTAYSLYHAWKNHVGPVAGYAQGVRMQSDGSFIAIYGALDFDYSAKDKGLKVMRVLTRGPIKAAAPGVVRELELAKLEPWSMGAAHFYLNPRPWISAVEQAEDPDMNTDNLMRKFTNNKVDPKRFVTNLRWLVFWGEYWRSGVPGVKESGTDRAWRTPEEQAATRPALKKWAMKVLSRPEPPDVRTAF